MFGPVFGFFSLISAYLLFGFVLVGLVVGMHFLHEQMEEFPMIGKKILWGIAVVVLLFHVLSLVEGISFWMVLLGLLTNGFAMYILRNHHGFFLNLSDWRVVLWLGTNACNIIAWTIYLKWGWVPSLYSRMSRLLYAVVVVLLFPACMIVGSSPLEGAGSLRRGQDVSPFGAQHQRVVNPSKYTLGRLRNFFSPSASGQRID